MQLWGAEGQTFILLSPCVCIPNFLSVHPGFLSQRPFPAMLANLQEKSRWLLDKAFLGLKGSLPHSLFTRTLGENLNMLWRAAGTQGLASPAISRRFFRLTRETLEGNPSGSKVHPFYGHVLSYCGASPVRIFWHSRGYRSFVFVQKANTIFRIHNSSLMLKGLRIPANAFLFLGSSQS